jgi:hypothetical protein
MKTPILLASLVALTILSADSSYASGEPQATRGKASVDAPAPTAGLRLFFSANSLTVSGITPSAKVAIISIAREPRKYYSETVRRIETLTDSDGDGSVVLQLPAGIAPRAIWEAVDLMTGSYVVEPSPGYDNPPIPLSAAAFKRSNAKLTKFEVDLGEVEMVLVRPAGGLWLLTAWRNSTVDENRNTNLPMRLDVSRLRPTAKEGAAPPESFEPGDIVLVVNPRWMTWASVGVPK